MRIRDALLHPVVRSMGGVGAAAAAGQLITLAAAPFLARIYDQEAFGTFGLFFGVANVIATLSMLGLNDAIIAADDESTAKAVARTCVITSVILLGPAILLVVLLRQFGLFGLQQLPVIALWLLVIEIPVLCALSIIQAGLVRAQRFAVIARGHLALGSARALGQIVAGFLLGAFTGLAAGEICSRLVTAFAMFSGTAEPDRNNRVSAPAVLRRFRNFIVFRTPSTVLGAISVVAPTFVMASAFDVRQAGFFSLMYTTIMAPMAFAQKAVGDVFLGHYAQRRRDDSRGGSVFFRNTVVALAIPGAFAAALVYCAGPLFFEAIFGPQWKTSGEMAAAASPLLFATLVVVPVSQIINVANKPHLKLVFDIATLTGLALVFVLGTNAGLTPIAFVSLMAWTLTAAYALFLILIARVAGLSGTAAPDRPRVEQID